jgi:hypothetical protein
MATIVEPIDTANSARKSFRWFGLFRRQPGPEEAYVGLIDTTQLERFIDGKIDLRPYKEDLTTRWLHQVGHWDLHARRAHRKYVRLRGTVIVVGLIIPVLASLSFTGHLDFLGTVIDYEFLRRAALVILGLVVAICAAWEGFQNYGEIWRTKRRAADLLHVEGWRFFQHSGEYKGGYDKTYSLFADQTEDIIQRAIQDYITLTRTDRTEPVPAVVATVVPPV